MKPRVRLGPGFAWFQLESHDSFKINGETSLWHWKSRDIGGRSALDYLIHVEEKGFVEAVGEVLSALGRADFAQHEWVPQERPRARCPRGQYAPFDFSETKP